MLFPEVSVPRGRSALLWLLAIAGALAGTPLAAPAQQPVSADSSVPLFVVMSAMNAAGYDADLDSPQNSPVRGQVRQAIEAARPAVLPSLRSFYTAHRHPSAARDLSQFISFALLINGPPDFAFRVKETELPADVAALRELRPLLAALYKEAALDQLWEKHRGAYESELARYDDGLARVMLEVNGYLRLPSSGFLGRNFWIYVDLLGAPGQVNARSFGPDYYVVSGVTARPQFDEVRHGYLHYVLDAMTAKYGSLVRSKSVLHAFADEAHALDPVLRKDFRLLVTESLIRAVELRLSAGSPMARQQRLREVLAEGHFLAPYFFEALEKFEKQEVGMRLYITDLLEKMDVGHEQKRLARVVFRPGTPAVGAAHSVPLSNVSAASEPAGKDAGGQPGAFAPGVAGGQPGAFPPGVAGPVAAKPIPATVLPAGASEEEKLVAQGEDALARRDLSDARRSFQAALEKQGELKGQATYGLALVATLDGQAEVAKAYFQQTLQITREPRLLAWTHIYLGRIFDMERNRERAVKHYEQALAAGDSQPATRLAAERGLQVPFRREAPDKNQEAPESRQPGANAPGGRP